MTEGAAAEETLDILCNEGLHLIQKRIGYRFSIDAILLANFTVLRKGERLLDIGTGCGIIPVYMSRKGIANRMVGIEIQKGLFDTSQKNKELNGCDNIEFRFGDILLESASLKRTPFHVVVSNPPYTKARSGRKSPELSRYIARYETCLDLEGLLSATSALLFKKGRFCVIYPPRRLGELICMARSFKLEVKRLRFVHPRYSKPANLVLGEFMKEAGSGVTVEKPLYVYENGEYSDEIKGYYTLKP